MSRDLMRRELRFYQDLDNLAHFSLTRLEWQAGQCS